MKSIKLWQVRHYQGERLKPLVNYAATKEVAQKLSAKPWGWHGFSGSAAEVELKIYEDVSEV